MTPFVITGLSNWNILLSIIYAISRPSFNPLPGCLDQILQREGEITPCYTGTGRVKTPFKFCFKLFDNENLHLNKNI